MLLRRLMKRICAKQPPCQLLHAQMNIPNEPYTMSTRENGKTALLREKADIDSDENRLVAEWLFGFKRDF